ncbi:hypothetical protein [Thermanaeromonas sp. C210]|nr:hypothetical protein [Thermanaeromonas sp. C210]
MARREDEGLELALKLLKGVVTGSCTRLAGSRQERNLKSIRPEVKG